VLGNKTANWARLIGTKNPKNMVVAWQMKMSANVSCDLIPMLMAMAMAMVDALAQSAIHETTVTMRFECAV